MPVYKDLVGMKFGRLTVLSRADNYKNYAMWLCRCECGNEITVRTSSLKNGHTASCGCYHKERAKQANSKHGMYQSRLYGIYTHMIGRCYKENEHGYQNYGGRGITVCDEWLEDFSSFASWAMQNGYSDDLSIDRIDVDGNYCPENCRWATQKVQANNMRTNRILEYKGEKYTMSELAETCGVPYGLLDSRIFRGWDIDKAVETPVKAGYRR